MPRITISTDLYMKLISLRSLLQTLSPNKKVEFVNVVENVIVKGLKD